MLASGLGLAAACTTAPAGPAFDGEAEAAEIDQLRADFMAAMAAQDFAALGALSHPDFQQTVPGGPAHLEMLAAAGNVPFPPGYQLDITPKELVIINEDGPTNTAPPCSHTCPRARARGSRSRTPTS